MQFMTQSRRELATETLDDFDNFLESLAPARKRPHFEVSGIMKDIEPIFVQLSKDLLKYGAVSQISQKSGLNYETLRDWRSKLLQNPEWRPYQNRNIHKRALSPQAEARLAQKIREEYIMTSKYCPMRVLKRLAHEFYVEDLEWDEARKKREADDFKASSHWCVMFLKRHGLSMRKHHKKRRKYGDDSFVAFFYERMDVVFAGTPRDRIINMDETCWHFLQAGGTTIAERGAESVSCVFNVDEKKAITAICSIDAAGNTLPIWVLAKGTTSRCEQALRENDEIQRHLHSGRLIIDHSESGWTNSDVAIRYLQWLASRYDQTVTLVWDLYAAHRNARVKTAAQEANVNLEFIPAGRTDTLQPLDYRIFGPLKQSARSRFDDKWARGETNIGIVEAVLSLLDVWNNIDCYSVLDAWTAITE